jgi:hypothetical protein
MYSVAGHRHSPRRVGVIKKIKNKVFLISGHQNDNPRSGSGS